MKFGTAHGRSRPEVDSTKCIDVYGSGGVYRPYRVIWYAQLKTIVLFDILRTKQNFFSLTAWSWDQYLQNGSEIKVVLSIDSSAVAYYQFPFVICRARSKYGKPVCSVYVNVFYTFSKVGPCRSNIKRDIHVQLENTL